MAHPVVHAEIRSKDPDATRKFFGDFLTAMPWRDSHLAPGGRQVRRHRLDDETAYGRLQ